MSANFRTYDANDLLNLNMQSISNELSELLVGGGGAVGGGGCGVGGVGGVEGVGSGTAPIELNAAGGVAGAVCLDYLGTARLNDAELLQCYRNYYYQQQFQSQQQLQKQQQQQQYAASSLFATPPPPLPPAHAQKPQAPEFVASHASASPPQFEFHYLRYQTFNKTKSNTEAVPLISSASFSDAAQEHAAGAVGGGASGGGGFRKYQKPMPKYHNNNNHEGLPKKVDYDKVVVDLSLIGLSIDNKEKNPVLRLFELFRLMHYYLNDIFPSGDGINPDPATLDVVGSYNSTTAKTSASMPCTMNVQYQVKQAARKCTIFLCDMQRILNANKLYDREKYLECERSLNELRKLIVQFEMYKRVELEHKRGRFVTEEGRAQAERLELLIEQLNDKIRESHLYIHVFNWSMQRKYVKGMSGETAAYQQQQQPPIAAMQSNETAGVSLAVPTALYGGGSGNGGPGAGGGGANGRSAHLNDQFGAASGTHSPIRNIG